MVLSPRRHDERLGAIALLLSFALLVSHGCAEWVPGATLVDNDSGRLELQVNPDLSDSSCVLFDFRSNVTAPFCGLFQCPCDAIQPAINAASLLLDVTAVAPSNVTSIQVSVYKDGVLNDTLTYQLPTVLEADVHVFSGTYRGIDNSQLTIVGHSISIIGNELISPTVFGTGTDDSPVLTIVDCSSCSVSNMLFMSFEGGAATTTSLIMITNTTLSMTNCGFEELFGHTMYVFQLGVAGSQDRSYLTLEHVSLNGCQIRALLLAEAPTDFSGSFVTISQSRISQLGIVHAISYFSMTHFTYLLSAQDLASDFLILMASQGSVITLDDWLISTSTLADGNFVSIYGPEDLSVQVSAERWTVKEVRGTKATLLGANICVVTAADWEVTNVDVARGIALAHCLLYLSRSSFDNMDVVSLFEGGAGTDWAMADVSISAVSATRAVFSSGVENISAPPSEVSITHCDFTDNIRGPVLELYHCNVYVSACQFIDNPAVFRVVGTNDKGSISITDTSVIMATQPLSTTNKLFGSVTISDCHFYGVHPNLIQFEDCKGGFASVSVTNSQFTNFAVSGGAFQSYFSGCTFSNSQTFLGQSQPVNSIILRGGARYGTITQCRFQPGPRLSVPPGSIVYVGQPGSVVISPSAVANVTVSNCHFEEKIAYQGAGIFSSGTYLTIEHSYFSSMLAHSGGAIFAQDGTMIIRDSLFHLNTAEQQGGDITVSGNAEVLFSDLSCFNSTSFSSGGALYFSGSVTGSITDATVRYSSAVQGAAVTTAGNAEVQFLGCILSNGTSSSSGGAVSTRQNSRPHFVNCFMGHNRASSYGGSVLAADTSSPSFLDCTFRHNFAGTSGGSLFAQDSSTLHLEESLVTRSFSESVGAGVGVAGNAKVFAKNTNFTRNQVSIFGGGLGASDRGGLYLSNCVVDFNRGLYGGGIGITQYAILRMFGSKVVNNTAYAGGGIRASGRAEMTLQGTDFTRNSVNTSGGGISTSDQIYASISGCIFRANHAQSGGAISKTSQIGMRVITSNFTGNSAGTDGGAITSEGEIFVHFCSFSHNEASRNGGALFCSGTAVVTLSTFILNAAVGSGGAFAGVGTFLQVADVSFVENSAGGDGGALHVVEGMLGEALSCNFTDNTASYGQGGAIFLDADRFQAYYCLFSGNTALLGGALLMMLPSDRTTVTTIFISSKFVENLSLTYGGAAAVLARQGLSSGSEIADCTDSVCKTVDPANSVVESINTDDDRPNLASNVFRDCLFSLNEAAASGGGIYLKHYFNGKFQMTDCTFEGNAASQFGGGVFLFTAGSEPLLLNASFVDNTIGVESTVDAAASSNLCQDCTFQLLPSSEGYETSKGYATHGTYCPGIQTLDGAPFSVDVGMRDGFGTPVTGAIYDTGQYSVWFGWNGTDCSVTSPDQGAEVIDGSGVSKFKNITMEGKNNSTCVLQFTYSTTGGAASGEQEVYADLYHDQGHTQSQASLSCQVILGGCSGTSLVVQEGDDVDTCGNEPVWGIFIVVGLLIALLVLVCVLFIVIIMHQYREKQRLAEESYYEDLEIADDIMSRTSLEDILNDPAITRIPWHELEIKERIGRGASGIVSSALWIHDGEEREVAMKELTLQLEDMDEQAAQDFLVEIRLMNALRHSRVVRFEGVAFNEGQLYLVTELMQFGSVKDVMLRKGRNLSWKVRTKLLHDAAMGMQYLHSKKLIHRDLKPQNLLVNNKWVCKVADFGVSTIKTTTRTMTAIGTPVYMAPEVLNNERYSETADVYSFGILVAEVYTGRQPYSERGLNDAQLLYKIYHDALRPSTAGLPDLARQLVEEAVTREASLRPTFAELVLRLKRISKLAAPVTDPTHEHHDADGSVEVEFGLFESGASLGVAHDTGGSLGLDAEDLVAGDSLQRTGGSINAEML